MQINLINNTRQNGSGIYRIPFIVLKNPPQTITMTRFGSCSFQLLLQI